MKITLSKSELVAALDTVMKATSSRTTVPSLAGILITAEQDTITFFASDLETSIQTSAAGVIDEPGVLAVPGKIFTSVIKSLPEAGVVIKSDGKTAIIICNQSRTVINTLNADDFRRFPDITGIKNITLPTDTVQEMVRKVSKAVSTDETRAVLTGILLTIDKEIVKMVATDSYRLTLVEKFFDEPVTEDFEVLVPGKAFEDVTKMFGSAPTVTITLTSNQILFTFGNTSFVTRRLDGKYVNYTQLIPKSWKTKFTVSLHEFSEAVKRVSILAYKNTAITINCSAEDQQVSLVSNSQDLGNAIDRIAAKVEGDSQSMAFNYNYIQDGLSVINNEFVSLEFIGNKNPCVLRCPEEGFTYLMMPVKTNQ